MATEFKTHNKATAKWLILSITAMLSTGTATIIQKLYNKSSLAGNSGAFISSSYIFAAIIALCVYFAVRKKGEKRAFKKTAAVKYALLTGITLSIFQWFYNYGIKTLDGTFFFPTYSGGAILLSTVAGVFVFKDRLKAKHLVSLAIGTVAIILVNF